jgi:predicted AlkP superfamily phosphohydrolase/phosphomutase
MMRRKVAMVAVDAAELSFVQTHLDRLPNFARVLAEGALRRLESTASRMSGSVWPTFYTGTRPGTHGIYHHLQWDADLMRLRRVSADWLDCEPFWYDLERRGCRVVVVDVPMTFASRLDRGIEITNWGSHDTLGPPAVRPAALGRDIRRRFGKQHPMGFEIPVNKSRGELERIRRNLIAGARLKGELCRWLLETQDWDFFLAVFGECHRGGHILWPREDDPLVPSTALLEVYQAVDAALGEILDGLSLDDVTVVVFAVHGMGPNRSQEHFMPRIMDRVNVRFGATQDAPGATPPASQRGLMRRLRESLPAGLQNAIASAVPVAVRDEVVNRAIVGGHDWGRTPGFALLADLHGYIRLNLRGRERQGALDADGGLDRYLECVRMSLHNLRVSGSGEPLIERVVLARDEFPGTRSDRLPDVIVCWAEQAAAQRLESDALGPIEAAMATGRSGNHRSDGFAVLLDRRLDASRILPAHIEGLAPMARRLMLE